jgi:hypothetical protein
MNQTNASASFRARPRPQVDEEEYIKYLMFLSEAVHSASSEADPDTHVPKLSTLISKARDASLRPYYHFPGTSGFPQLFTEGELPPISNIRQTNVKLPYIEPTTRRPDPRLY